MIEISTNRIIRHDHQATTIEQSIRRKTMRRRRVAKRMAERFPLFAVEFMQDEFPGYTYDEWLADVTRKTRKIKSFRRPKPRKFDWERILREIPEFFSACKQRTPTRAVLHGKTRDGEKFTCVVRSVYWDGSGQRRLDTSSLIKLWRGPIKTFLSHPAMELHEHQNKLS